MSWRSSNSHQSESGWVLMSPRPSTPCAQRFIEGMNQLLVPVLGLQQPRKEPRHERNEGRENRDR